LSTATRCHSGQSRENYVGGAGQFDDDWMLTGKRGMRGAYRGMEKNIALAVVAAIVVFAAVYALSAWRKDQGRR
jgi:hypothetical protein